MNINLLEMSFTGAVLIAAVLILRALLLNRLPKRTFPALWGVAILRLLLPFSVASALSVYSLFPLPLEQPSEQFPTEPPVSAPVTQTAPRIPEAVVTEAAPAPHPLPQKTETTYFAENAPSEPTKPAELPAAAEPVSAETVWFFVWCSGAVLSLSGFAAVYLRERRKFRASIPVEGGYTADWLTAHPIRRRVTVRRSDRIDAPLTYGLFRPVILLPDSMDRTDEKRLDYVLTHEMVHICRFDAVKKPICALALCVHWFNPLVWVMFFLFSRDLELACDEGVVRRLGEDQKSDYAKALIGMEAERSGFLPLFSRFGGFAAEERIRAIMKIKKSSAIAGAAACLLVCATAGVFATSAAQTEEEDTTVVSEETLTDVMFDDGRTVSPVEWWTAEEYEQWIIEQEKEMESLIGTGSGWYDREGVFHEFTREVADSTIAEYREILEQIKQGLLLSKDNGDHVVFSTIPPSEQSAASEADGYAALERAIRPYMPFGVGVRHGADGEPEIVYYEEDGVMRGADGEPKTVYRGKTVRSLYDAASGEKITAHAGEWDYGADAVDLYAVYEYGVLTRVCEAGGESTLLFDDGNVKIYSGNVPNPEWTQTFAESGGAIEPIDEAALFAEYEAHGLTRRESDGALFYKGTRVRWFIDGVDLDGEGAFATRYTYHNENGVIDLHTVWEKKKNSDGSYDPFGTLVAIEEYADFVPSLVIAEHEAVTAIALEEEKNAELPETPDERPKRSPKLKFRQDKDLLEALAEQESAPLDQEYMSDPFVSSTNVTFEKLPHGTEVHSVADGTVVFSEFAFNGSGLTVVVRSEDGTCWGYGHCDPDLYTASLGDTVKAGDVIAHAGTTGFTAGTALCLFLAEDDGSTFASAAPESVQMTTAEGSDGSGGRTFSEIFAEYEWFGITYNEAEGNVYFNGKLVGTFVDQTGSGVFSYQSRNVGNRATIDVRTRRYPSGKLTSVEEMTEEEKNAGFLEAPN